MANFYNITTNIGNAIIANATLLEQEAGLTHMAVGDGNGNPTTPNPAQTALINEVYRAHINQLTRDPNNPNYIIAEMIIPTNVGGWTVREVGIFDADGNLFAVGNFPDTYKPVLAEGSARELKIRMVMEVSNASVVTLKVDPTIIMASQQWVIENFSISLATETAAGIARIATAEEAAAGEDDGLIITPAKLANALKNISTLPVGFMTMWPSATLTAGGKWMERNGDILAVADYPDLFAILGNIYGGDGTTTFALPDDRGLVERGWDHGRGYDSARTFGSEQADAIRNIAGLAGAPIMWGAGVNGAFYIGDRNYGGYAGGGNGSSYNMHFDSSLSVPTAPENRVRNRAYLPIIKAVP